MQELTECSVSGCASGCTHWLSCRILLRGKHCLCIKQLILTRQSCFYISVHCNFYFFGISVIQKVLYRWTALSILNIVCVCSVLKCPCNVISSWICYSQRAVWLNPLCGNHYDYVLFVTLPWFHHIYKLLIDIVTLLYA